MSDQAVARLITIPISHYCERARWALQLADIAYVEEQHIQMLAWPHAWWHGRVKTVPVLIVAGDNPLTDSADIVRYADKHRKQGASLYPQDPIFAKEVARYERQFENRLGVEGRRLMYWHFFRWGREVMKYNNADAPSWEKLCFDLFYSVMKPYAKKYLAVSDETAKSAEMMVDEIFDEVSEIISDGRAYLVGDSFTAADLTFASMAAALIVPNTYGVRLPQPDEMPDDTARLVKKYRDHPAGKFALNLYEKYHYQSR